MPTGGWRQMWHVSPMRGAECHSAATATRRRQLGGRDVGRVRQGWGEPMARRGVAGWGEMGGRRSGANAEGGKADASAKPEAAGGRAGASLRPYLGPRRAGRSAASGRSIFSIRPSRRGTPRRAPRSPESRWPRRSNAHFAARSTQRWWSTGAAPNGVVGLLLCPTAMTALTI